MSRRKPVDKSADFEEFIQQTSDYLPPSKSKDNDTVSNTKTENENNADITKLTTTDKDKQFPEEIEGQFSKETNKQSNKQKNTKPSKHKKKVYIGDLFEEPVAKEPIVNTTLQLPQSLNDRLKGFCKEFGLSKNEVVRTLVEALLDEKGF